jgi:cytochrome c553
MKITKTAIRALCGGAFLGAAALFLVACTSTSTGPNGAVTTATADKGGAQLWAESCVRCHNVRSPSVYSDGGWEVAMHHMRIRANLTAAESTKILEFLKSAN